MDSLAIRHTKWTDRLAFDIALNQEGSGETITEIIERHAITPDELVVILKDKVFRHKVRQYRQEIADNGITFKLKARAQAEELLDTTYLMIHDPAVAPSVKADLIKSVVKWSGLEPKGEVATSEGNGVSITINLGETQKEVKTITTLEG